MRDAASVRLQAVVDVDFHTPDGSRLWITTLLPDPDCGEQRHRLHIVGTAESEEAARQVLSLAALRIRAALQPIEEAT